MTILGYRPRHLAGLATFYLVTLAGGLLFTVALFHTWDDAHPVDIAIMEGAL